MEYIMLATSITSMVLQNGVLNLVSKKYFIGQKDAVRFNLFMHGFCFIVFGLYAFYGDISLYSVTLGLIYGIATALHSIFKIIALTDGPMHITNLITTSYMIIPAMSGVAMYNEPFSMTKLVLVFVLIFFIYLSLGRGTDMKMSAKWMVCCVVAFGSGAAAGILQKVHQNSAHSKETAVFLASAFLCSLICSVVGSKGIRTKQKPRFYIYALLCGVCVYAMNHINLVLSGVLPSQLFFPLVNGVTIILSSIVSLTIFKEKLCKRQVLGLVGGIVTLILFCIF